MKLILTIVLSFVITLSAVGQADNDISIQTEILRLDSLLFQEGFNKCRTDVLSEIVANDFEMYHDQSGITYGRENFIEGIENNICALEYKPFRKLISSDIQILMSNGNIYGVLQNGKHNSTLLNKKKSLT